MSAPSRSAPGGLVGRDEVLAAVDRLVEGATAGRGGLLVVTGPAGVGLTAVAEAADDRAREAGHTVVWGLPHPADPGSPWPQVLEALAPDDRSTPATPAPRASDLLAQVIGPTTVVVDAAERMDGAGRDLLDDLARRVRNHPVVVVVVGADPFAPAPTPGGSSALRLTDLDEAQVAQVVAGRLPGAGGARVREVHAATGGIPALVVAACAGAGAGPDVPRLVADLVGRRLAAVDEDAGDVALATAAFDEPVPRGLLALLTHRPVRAAHAVLPALVRAGLLAADDDVATVPAALVRGALRDLLGVEAPALADRGWTFAAAGPPSPASPSPPAVDPLHRPGLLARLEAAADHRLVTVVADAGFGKTTALAAWADATARRVAIMTATAAIDDAAWLEDGIRTALAPHVDLPDAAPIARGPDAVTDPRTMGHRTASDLAALLDAHLVEPLTLVVDDVHVLTDPEALALLDGLVRTAPPALGVVLSGRHLDRLELARLRATGAVADLTGDDLAFDVADVAALLDVDDATADEVRAATGGWPIAVRMLAEALARHPDTDVPALLARLSGPAGPLVGVLVDDALAAEPPDVTQLLRAATATPSLTPAVADALGLADAPTRLARLAGRRLLADALEDGRVGVRRLVADLLAERDPLGPRERRTVLRRTADAHTAAGRLRDALAALVALDDPDRLTAFLSVHGAAMATAGAAGAVRDALSGRSVPPALVQLRGECARQLGDWDLALRDLREAAGDADALPAGLAWRTAVIHQHRGEHDEALAVCERGIRDGADPVDEAILEGWTAALHWVRADVDAARAAAARAHDLALATDDAGALSTSHTALALVAALDGDRDANLRHHTLALEAARAAGDVLQQLRVLINRSAHHGEEGAYAEALADLDAAVDLAERGGFEHIRAVAMVNRGEQLRRTGRLGEALASLGEGHRVLQRLGSRLVCYVLVDLADVHADQGDVGRALVEVEKAVRLAEEAGDHQGLVPALCLQARLLAADDPAAAADALARARAAGPGMHDTLTAVTGAWVALGAGDDAAARDAAAVAADRAGRRRDRGRLAEAQLLAALAAEGRPDPAGVDEAAEGWAALGDVAGTAFGRLVAALLRGDADAAADARERLVTFDARGLVDRAEVLVAPAPATSASAGLRIATLGGFAVVRDGEAVPASAWQSRKARDLLKLLVVRRGVPATRDALAEALWPGDDPARLGSRLSVALSLLRRALVGPDGDTADAPITADARSVALDLTRVDVDVESFSAAADDALAAFRDRAPDAADRLAAVEAAYRGDFLEEDAYADWAALLRDEARGTYVEVAVALAGLHAAAGRPDDAARLHRRVLDRDPFDETAHLGLVEALAAAGRHADARRAYDAYAGRMAELGVEPAAYPHARTSA